MRPLAFHEIDLVSGGNETVTYNLPAGSTMTMRLEANNSTTIDFTFPGLGSYTWNSGTFIACSLIGAGVGLTVTAFSGNPLLGSLSSSLASYGCTQLANQTGSDPADGD